MRIMLPVKCQKDHSGRGCFHKEMETILANSKNYFIDKTMLPVKCQKYHSGRGFFGQ